MCKTPGQAPRILKYREILFLALLFLLLQTPAFSQDKPPITFGKISPADFDLPKSAVIDSNTNAVIVADMGSTSFIGNKDDNWVSYVFKKNIRIKIVNKKAFELAVIKIQLYGAGKWQDRLEGLQASTYYLENGRVVETKLNVSDLFKDTLNRGHVEAKFSFPGIREGCIVEYSYIITSYHYWNLPPWRFQQVEYPCLYSQYQIAIPNMLGYVTLFYGLDSLNVNTSEKTKELYKMATVNVTAEVKSHTWLMKDIPPFKNELFLENLYDHIDKLEFHLAQTYNGENVNNFGNNWVSFNKELVESDDFGNALLTYNASNLLNTVEKITSNDSNLLQSARNIYYYIRNNFISRRDDEIYLRRNLYEVNKKRSGNVAEINLLLTAMLRQKGITANPVILSTRENGVNSSQYPDYDKINYVICMAKIFGDTVYLDATQPKLKFGRLHLDCYNGHARVISDTDSGSVFFNTNNIKEQNTTTVFIGNDENGKISGTFQNTPGYFGSEDMREKVKKHGVDFFFDKLKTSLQSEIIIANPGIDSLSNPDFPVKLYYDFSFPENDNPDIMYFNPVIGESYTENPFKSSQRKLPVEMPYPVDNMYLLNMEIPNGYTVDELPKSVKVAYNDNEGFFEYIIQKSETNIQLRSHIKLLNAIFLPEEYNSLRDFFAYVVKKQSEQIVFKKKK